MKSPRPDNRASASTTGLSSPAWLLRGISSIPGELRLGDSRLSFIAQDPGTAWDWQLRKLERVAGSPGFMAKLKAGSAVALFDEPLTKILVRSPWYYFSGGLVLQILGQSYKVSFGQPAGSSNASDGFETVSAMRQVGKRWLHVLTAQ